MANKASVADQQKQVQENVHSQLKSFCTFMDEILLPDVNKTDTAPAVDSPVSSKAHHRSGLSFAVGGSGSTERRHGEFFCTNLILFHESKRRVSIR